MGIDLKEGISINNLEINYGNYNVISDFNLNIKKGEIVTLFGPSGCGKSTILKAVINQISISKGSIIIDGINSNKYNKPLAYTPQSNELLPWKTVKDNIELIYKDTIGYLKEFTDSPKQVIDFVELNQQENKYPKELSGGMERRTALARCICTNSDFMFLDEAFVAVERRLRRKLMTKIREKIKLNNMTSLIISHDYEEAIYLSDKIILFTPPPTVIYKTIDVNNYFENSVRDDSFFESDVFLKIYNSMI